MTSDEDAARAFQMAQIERLVKWVDECKVADKRGIQRPAVPLGEDGKIDPSA